MRKGRARGERNKFNMFLKQASGFFSRVSKFVKIFYRASIFRLINADFAGTKRISRRKVSHRGLDTNPFRDSGRD